MFYKIFYNLKSKIFISTLLSACLLSYVPAYSAGKIIVSVNGNAITDEDINHRIALLRMQHIPGNIPQLAKQQLIDDMLKNLEIENRNMAVSNKEVEMQYLDFAKRNHVSKAQLSALLEQNNITADHFKRYIATQMGWQRLLVSRYRAEHGANGLISAQDAANEQIERGGIKPETTEYQLQQITFVLPDHVTNRIKQRRIREIKSFKRAFRGCDSSYDLSQRFNDVVIRDLGRVLKPALPDEWKNQVIKTRVGYTTPYIENSDGLVVIAVCGKRQVSDDRVAQLVFSIKKTQGNNLAIFNELNKKYMDELRKSARIS